jgi:hypothetical protein
VPHPRHGESGHCAHCPGSHTGQLPCLASATTKARAWLLVEHPGPWAEEIDDTDVPAPIAAALAEAARLGVRRQLIRPTGRRRTAQSPRVYTGWSGSGRPVWLEGRELSDPAELADLDLAAVAAGRSLKFGDPVTEPLFLVCAHGRHNACCARSGAPLARALGDRFGSSVWETTHVGGDRFAANLVCLPHGLYYGDLGLDEALSAVAAYHEGKVTLDRLRGRAGLPEPAQAAEHHVRALTGELGVDAASVESITGGNPDFDVVVSAGINRYRVPVRPAPAAEPCGPGCEESRRTYLCGDPALLNQAALV